MDFSGFLISLAITILIGSDFKSNALQTSPSFQYELKIDPQSLTSTVGQGVNFTLIAQAYYCSEENATLLWSTEDEVTIIPPSIVLSSKCERNALQTEQYLVCISSEKQGRFLINSLPLPHRLADDSRLFAQLKVAQCRSLIIVSTVIGWMYTFCWTIGDYFQVWTNFKRKSVVGLSFDFLYLNVVGNFCYSTFNAVLFWNDHVEQEYFQRHPFGLNPVVPNDVGYALHAVFGNCVLIAQCLLYPSDGNVVSRPVKILIACYISLVTVVSGLAFWGQIFWLDFLYVLSYVKLSTNLIKYFPQVYMNFKRKSTVGFSISNRFLDMGGGILSLLQMILNCWNFDDWQSIGGSPVKFALGFVAILFDVLFMVQHFICYREAQHSNNK
ncbi:cystinosin homolog isoform X1 [Anopheles albimanus]|uniref:cystinosin homolog isoform X1 n=1 Tax=Anopheles albimanus TaxID=7167 RepID=UPI00163F5751|nr:cystinosin homolog isoform X1 [Anopheles albimanus]